jgi:hypothetical protein
LAEPLTNNGALGLQAGVTAKPANLLLTSVGRNGTKPELGVFGQHQLLPKNVMKPLADTFEHAQDVYCAKENAIAKALSRLPAVLKSDGKKARGIVCWEPKV